jgi:hypothetical protein
MSTQTVTPRSDKDVVPNADSRILRRSSRIAAKSAKSIEMLAEKVEQSIEKPKDNCNCNDNCKKCHLVGLIKNFMSSMQATGVSVEFQLKTAITLFTLIEKELAFLCSSDFDWTGKFIDVVLMKTTELQGQINTKLYLSEQLRNQAITLLQRVHKKIHLYIIKQKVSNMYYDEFLNKFIDQF